MGLFTRTSKPTPIASLEMQEASTAGLFNPVGEQFVEMHGRYQVHSARMFIVSIVALAITVVAVVGMFSIGSNKKVVPMFVEIAAQTGEVVGKPVIVEKVTPGQASVKADLGHWAEMVFTIDNALTKRNWAAANVRTRGLATKQFESFRTEEDTFNKLAKDPSIRRDVRVTSVDASTQGIAFIFLTTNEPNVTDSKGLVHKYRLSLKYEIDPGTTEEEILKNPLGLFVTNFIYTEER